MVIYFSGTGNSRFVACSLGKTLNEEVAEITVSGISAQPLPEDRIIWVFPVYAWGIPGIVRRTVTALASAQPSSGRKNYMVCTCGDDIGEAHLMWRKLITDCSWDPCATFSVTMPNTYVLLPGFDVDSKEVERAKLSEAPERIKTIAARIKSGWRGDDVTTGSFKWLKTACFYPFFMRYLMSPKPFHALTDTCIKCGKCIKTCPMNNIAWGNDKYPEWGDNCEMCLACYHCCPTHSVAYGNKTRAKGQYRFPSEQ